MFQETQNWDEDGAVGEVGWRLFKLRRKSCYCGEKEEDEASETPTHDCQMCTDCYGKHLVSLDVLAHVRWCPADRTDTSCRLLRHKTC